MIHSKAPRRSRIQLLALSAVLGLSLVGLTQCRGVSDRVTGLELNTAHGLSGRSSCTRQCNDQFKAAMVAEQERFLAAKRACGRDVACKQSEDRKHVWNVQQLQQQKSRCKHSCYNEGAGTGGA